MRTEHEIRARLAEIQGDERLGYPTATVEVNAPLALIQIEGRAVMQALSWALGEGSYCAASFPSALSGPIRNRSAKP